MINKLKLIVLGMMGRCPYGGQTWLYLNWLHGLNNLGHEVWYVEDDLIWPYDPVQETKDNHCSYALKHISNCMDRIGLPNKWAYRLAGQNGGCWGLSDKELNDLYGSCDALLNIVGATTLRKEHMRAKYRVYLETDPVTLELQLHESQGDTRNPFDDHNAIVTYGENYGSPDCGVPLNGIKYKKTRQPIDLKLWPMVFNPKATHFTTIGNYRQEGKDMLYKGEIYKWSKHHEWRKFLRLPQYCSQPFELAMSIKDKDDYDLLSTNGWRLVNPIEMSLDIFGRYRTYIQESRAEFTVAKDQNVRLRSGWFSERDACYLATGKPVVAQDTGFSNVLPTGEGLFAFTNMEQAIAAIDAINSNYKKHCIAARDIAYEYFEAKKVAAHFITDLGLS